MLYEICNEINNFFTTNEDKKIGLIEIKDGQLSPSFDLVNGQYYRIIGSVFNDGIHKYGVGRLQDEEFKGAVWLMRVPKDFLDLVKEIQSYVEKNDQTNTFVSESFGGYSYTKATKDGMPLNWRDVYRKRLNMWRKLR